MVNAFATVMDIMPTILDLAGVTHPVPITEKMGMYQGREVYRMRGKSWLPFFSSNRRDGGSAEAIHGEEEFMGWELFGRAALRKGKWKASVLGTEVSNPDVPQIVWMPLTAWGKEKWELFDLSVDPGETNDLADAMPDKVDELLVHWATYVKETGTQWGAPVKGELNWAPLPDDSVGGDPIEQTQSWMMVGEGEPAGVRK